MHPFLLKQLEDPDFINEYFAKEDRSNHEMINIAESGGGDDDGDKSIN